MIPQLVIAMLACARIGAVHSVVFAGFSSGALSNRINDAKAAVLLPKTRSGKIMRRILKKIAAGETKDFGDTSTLIEPNVITDIIAHLEMA